MLDACRFDTFEARHDHLGELESRRNVSSSTIEFLHRQFDGADLSDTVCVTLNPQMYRRQENLDLNVHEVINVRQDEGWDEPFKTVRPETVVESALTAAERYPHKRLLVHFIQPHVPLIGPTGKAHFEGDSLKFWMRINNDEIDVDDETVWQAYEGNFDLPLPHVEALMMELRGKTVVSADHGQMIAERALDPVTGVWSSELRLR